MLIGSAFAKKRYEKYKNIVSWDHHSQYKTRDIWRAYIMRTASGEPKLIGLYRVECHGHTIVGTTLDEIRTTYSEYLMFGAPEAIE